MLVYTVVLGVVVFAIAWLLNKTVFDKNPAKRRVCNFLWAARSRLIDVGGDSVTK